MGTALNDDRVLRLTGSLPLVQKSLAGDVMVKFFGFGVWVIRGCLAAVSGQDLGG